MVSDIISISAETAEAWSRWGAGTVVEHMSVHNLLPILMLARYMPDTAENFPKGKWGTLQALQEQVDYWAVRQAAQYKERLSREDEPHWIATADRLPTQGEIVATKVVHDGKESMHARLRLVGALWFHATDDFYMYYDPTHWRPL